LSTQSSCLCTLDVYRALNPDTEEPIAPDVSAAEKATGGEAIALVVKEHKDIYRGLCKHNHRAALDLGSEPDPANPFRVVVMTAKGVRTFAVTAQIKKSGR
jgi:hypothetical protein